MMRKMILTFPIIFLLVLIAVMLWQEHSQKSLQVYTPVRKLLELPEHAPQHLSRAIRQVTISYENGDPEEINTSVFNDFHQLLEEMYPLVHEHMEVETVRNLSLMYKWTGRNPAEQPVLLLAHMDVVPAEDSESWTHPPFSGKIETEFIWGRGTLDNKGSLIGILEAAEQLLKEGFTPERSVYFAFGHDEEIGGQNGAGAIARQFKDQGIHFEYSLDEGGSVTEGIVPGMNSPVALIGIAEKGRLALELSVRTTGGHSSMPPEENSIAILSRAVNTLQHNPFPARISETVHAFLDHIGPEQSLVNRIAIANRWLFTPLILRQYSQSPAGNATVRTTSAPTIIRAGVQDNVVPEEATAIIDFRLLPDTTKDEVIEHVNNVIDDERVHIRPWGTFTPSSPVSSYESEGFSKIRDLARDHFDSIAVAPFLVIGGTDSRHYREVTQDTYRFLPVLLDGDDLNRIHGSDERISLNNFRTMISFYYYFLKAH